MNVPISGVEQGTSSPEIAQVGEPPSAGGLARPPARLACGWLARVVSCDVAVQVPGRADHAAARIVRHRRTRREQRGGGRGRQPAGQHVPSRSIVELHTSHGPEPVRCRPEVTTFRRGPDGAAPLGLPSFSTLS